LYHDDDLWNLTDRPLVARRVTPTTWSDAGAGFTGQFELESLGTIKGEAFVINGLTDGFSASTGGLRDARGSRESDSNNDKAFAGRLALAPSTNHEFAISGYNGNYDTHGNAITGIAFDSRNSIADFTLITELAQFNLDDGFNSAGSNAPDTIKGILVELGYQFWLDTLNSTFLGEDFENPRFILTARYNSASVERSAGDLDEDSYVAGLAWRPLTQFVVKTEYQWNSGELERKDADGFMTSVALGF
ncbi:MAG: hypothetical protein PHC51_13885, partial [bacterium]|nr:hypothetical protein [bacterium]